MTPQPDPHEQLERLIHHTLRDLPARRAPRSLESRVLAALAQRAALPWWRQDFAHWPMTARAAFLLGSLGVVLLVTGVLTGVDASTFADAFGSRFAGLENLTHLAGSVTDAIGAIGRNLPLLWVYAALGVFVAMYAALFGLGAAAYRTLYANR
jgi:hypothetical protein